MIIKNPSQEKLKEWSERINKHIEANFSLVETRFVDLGTKIVRILNYAKDFTPLMQKQLTYTLKDSNEFKGSAPSYDATIVLWQENNVNEFAKMLDKEFDPKHNIRVRIGMLLNKERHLLVKAFDDSYSHTIPLMDIHDGFVNLFDREANTYFYGAQNLEPEEFIKQGHIFVQIFNKILRTKDLNLTHGAVVGIDDKGILLCARGQRGKSTLAVLSMMEGFEYVSDDYLVLEKDGESLYTHPIYSIITLSPRMYNELYEKLEGTRFVSNNARKDKYVINIAKFHPQFRRKYPVEVCVFPEIVADSKPSICLCDLQEKGRAITQLIQSTVSQVQDINDHATILKLIDMVKDFEFYKINLCSDIAKNTQCLRDFIAQYKRQKSNIKLGKWLIDITFDIANIIDSENGIIYTMNQTATNIYENLIKGVSKEAIISAIESKIGTKHNIKWQVEKLAHELHSLGLFDSKATQTSPNNEPNIKFDFLTENHYNASFLKHENLGTIELIAPNATNKGESK